MRNRARAAGGVALAILFLFGGITAVRTQQAAPGAPQTPAGNPIAVYPPGYSPQWIEDADFVYGPALLDFDLKGYLDGSAPHLSRYADFISHWCGYYSISPRVLLTLIDMRSGLVSTQGTPASLENPLPGLAAGTGFEPQVQAVLARLFEDFYAFRAALAASGDTRAAGDINAATFALLNLFRAGAAPAAFAASADALRSDFLSRFERLFPTPTIRTESGRKAIAPAAVPPATLLQLPWRAGQSWFFNGVHTTSGSDPGVMSSIDFTRSWSLNWGDDTSTDYVVAAHAGTVTVFSSCSIRVTSSTGWATNYYHLGNVAVTSGAQVARNQVLAVYANTLSQALCQGGQSTSPHVHFSLLSGGVLTPLADASLSGYVVHPGRSSYDSDPAFMWLERAGTRYYAYSRALPSAVTTPVMSLDAPNSNSTIGRNVSIAGWAVDQGAASGTGVDGVVVYAYGSNGAAQFLGEAAYGIARQDVGNALGSQFTNSGFRMTATITPPDTYSIVAFMHSTVTGAYSTAVTASNVVIQATNSNATIFVDQPAQNATRARPFTLSGWAVDQGAASGSGIDAIALWAFPTNGAAATLVGLATYGTSRPDIGALLADSRYTPSGFTMTVNSANLPTAGVYDLIIFGRSTVTGSFTAARVVRVTVQ